MIGQPQVYQTLDRLHIAYQYYEHPEAPTIEIAAQFYRGEGTTLCKNLFLRNHKGNRHYLVVMDSRHDMDIHDMEHRLHQGKLSFASPERMNRCLGLKPGSVSLFGLVNDPQHQVFLFIDRSLTQAQKVSFHPNDNRASLVISVDDMMRFVHELEVPHEIVDLYNIDC